MSVRTPKSSTDGPLFIAPLAIEGFAVRRGAKRARVERMGMGPTRAIAMRVRLESRSDTTPLVMIGFGGGLVPGVHPGDVVVASSLLAMASSGEPSRGFSPRPPEAVSLGSSHGVAGRLRSAGLIVHEAPIISSSAVLRTDGDRSRATATGAVAVDMESYWCAPLALDRPFAVVRVIVDVPGHKLVSPATIGAGWRAYRSLVEVSRALAAWTSVSLDGNPLQEVGDR